jgi:hypothetical protein
MRDALHRQLHAGDTLMLRLTDGRNDPSLFVACCMTYAFYAAFIVKARGGMHVELCCECVAL